MDVVEELCVFSGLSLGEVRLRMDEQIARTARLFNEFEGGAESFYRSTDAYLFELANWEEDSHRSELAAVLGGGLGGKRLSVLEYGCGIGSFALKLAEQGFIVTACDVNEPCLTFLRQRVARRQWEQHVNVTSPDDALSVGPVYGLISCQHVLEHVTNPLHTLIRFRDCLMPGGMFVGIAPFSMVGPEFPEHDPKNAHLRLSSLCEEAGLRVEAIVPFGQVGNYTFELVQALKMDEQRKTP